MKSPDQFNKRRIEWSTVPAPMRVREEIIAECRVRVESRNKSLLRRILLPLVRVRLRPQELGEGYHWALSSRVQGARIGRFAYVGPGSDLSGPVVIGDLTMVSRNVSIFGLDHVHSDPLVPMRIGFPMMARPVTIIEADCWIGQNAQIKEGVRIRRGTVVAAGAVVTKDTTPYSVVAGIPAVSGAVRFSTSDQVAYDEMLYGSTELADAYHLEPAALSS